ncbi:MAG: 2-C-methyl-D-erythritol 4-phosphate cytidylyltransferase [Candidatus Latescibacterota bacterium]|jgi:2-C-methyl-D-erythritol 4-phosphate cytidylyltransferase/2-C-methyl-D-erythritol 2,4-cyclodiphosphate synthase
MAHIAALIMAAGRGDRFAGGTAKQLALVGGRPMVAWSIERLGNHPDVETVVLVIPPAQRDDWRIALAEPSGELVDHVVEGGERRQDSVRIGLEALPESATHVLIHDAARPCLSSGLLARIVEALDGNEAVVPVTPAVDTLAVDGGGTLEAIVDRANIAAVQTPQAFGKQLALRAHRKAFADGLQMNDDGSLVLALGEKVVTVAGERTNIKVTYPEDIAIAEKILSQIK